MAEYLNSCDIAIWLPLSLDGSYEFYSPQRLPRLPESKAGHTVNLSEQVDSHTRTEHTSIQADALPPSADSVDTA